LKRKLEEHPEQPGKPATILRSKHAKFDIKTDCLFCGLPVTAAKKKGVTTKCYQLRSFACQTSLQRVCEQRGAEDEWANTVSSRIAFAQDLPASDTQYHKQCDVNFRTMKNIPIACRSSSVSVQGSKDGKCEDTNRTQAFSKVILYLEENDEEQITLTDLCNKMAEYMDEGEPYCERTMRRKLDGYFGENILITNIMRKKNVVTFRPTAEGILKNFSESPKERDADKEKERIIKAAALLLLADIKNLELSKDEYPSSDKVADLQSNLDFIPHSMSTFLNTLLKGKNDPDLKIASLGQALMQAARPKAFVAPIQIGVGVALHHLVGSRYIIEHLNKLGFCSSYNEVKTFELSAAVSQGTDLVGIGPCSWMQFIGDNVDHQIQTLDGTGTFHGMGLIAAATPGTRERKAIRRDTTTKPADVSNFGKIPVQYFDKSTINLSLSYEELKDFKVEDHTSKLDLLWKISWPLRSPRPGWSGVMLSVNKGTYPGKSTFTFLPMIDLDPTNMSCVYSTLLFVSLMARRYFTTPVLTFDQPLWWKAMMIVDSEPDDSDLKSIVLRLGGFHTEMSFLGCIGHLMGGSGLQETLEGVFASNSVPHMLTGKCIARAVRGHFLVYCALNAIVASTTFHYPLQDEPSDSTMPVCAEGTAAAQRPEKEREQTSTSPDEPLESEEMADLRYALTLFDQIMSGDMSPDELAEEKDLEKIENMLLETKQRLQKGRTSRLWIQYMDMVDILIRYLKGERTGNWLLHLSTMQEMLPYMAAAGHNQYTKSIHIYLQHMQKLEEHHPDVFKLFMDGHHVLRRTDRYWAGLSPDLVIEQVLMKSVKSVGGLTRGRGMGESQRTQWLLSMPACADMNNAMQELTGLEFSTSPQHVETGNTRQARDDQDMKILVKYLLERNPFASDESLRNISTGVTNDSTVNADTAQAIGHDILKSMTGIPVKEFTFNKKNQAVTMNIKVCAKVGGENLHIDPQLLFQRLTTAVNAQPDEFDLPSILEYELCTPPPALFDPSGLMRESTKSTLADALMKAVKQEDCSIETEEHTHFVLDGGSLLHKTFWRKNDTFVAICDTYADYVTRHYGKPTVVFDGYLSGPTTKDAAHLRRSVGAVGPSVHFDEHMMLTSRKDHFLSNPNNKQSFVFLLGRVLESCGCRVLHAEADADNLIVKTATEHSAHSKTTVIGEDTDLLVLLCYHTLQCSKKLCFQSDKLAQNKKRVWHIQHLQKNLGPETCALLPFVHAVNGCDTTSRLFGLGKQVALKKLNDPNFVTQGHIFCKAGQHQDTIITAGEKALICLYSGRMEDNLNSLRSQRLHQKLSSCATAVQVKTLPPTSAAAKYHSLRVYLQVQVST